jgi:hypothetical protein
MRHRNSKFTYFLIYFLSYLSRRNHFSPALFHLLFPHQRIVWESANFRVLPVVILDVDASACFVTLTFYSKVGLCRGSLAGGSELIKPPSRTYLRGNPEMIAEAVLPVMYFFIFSMELERVILPVLQQLVGAHCWALARCLADPSSLYTCRSSTSKKFYLAKHRFWSA